MVKLMGVVHLAGGLEAQLMTIYRCWLFLPIAHRSAGACQIQPAGGSMLRMALLGRSNRNRAAVLGSARTGWRSGRGGGFGVITFVDIVLGM